MVKQRFFSLLLVLGAWGFALLTLLTNVWHSNSYFVFLITSAIIIATALLRKMISHNNVSSIELFGKGIPNEGRIATKEEASNIRQWLRNSKGVTVGDIANTSNYEVALHT